MNLDVQNWQPFRIDRLFDIYTGGDLIMGDLEEGDIPIASNSSENNNIAAYTDYIEGKKLFDHTISISVADRGKFWAFIQPKDFYLATRVKGLVCKGDNLLNEYQMAFVVSVLNQESFKYSYGRNCCAHLPDVEIFLPIQHHSDGSLIIDDSNRWSDNGYIPDWQFMEDYIKSLHHKPLATKNKPGQVPKLNVNEWKEFRVGDLFEIEPTKGVVTDDLIEGAEVPYMAAKHDGNGIEMICQKTGFEDWISKGNGIVFVNLGAGSAGYANYIKEDFIGMSGKTSCGYNPNLNEYNGLFIATVLCQERLKYSFGRSWTGSRLVDTIIKLPVDANGNPDWHFMENYIKALPYGDRLEG